MSAPPPIQDLEKRLPMATSTPTPICASTTTIAIINTAITNTAATIKTITHKLQRKIRAYDHVFLNMGKEKYQLLSRAIFLDSGVEPREISSLPADDRDCMICHAAYGEVDGDDCGDEDSVGECTAEGPIELTKCGHVMGADCYMAWADCYEQEDCNKCPKCRTELFDDAGDLSDRDLQLLDMMAAIKERVRRTKEELSAASGGDEEIRVAVIEKCEAAREKRVGKLSRADRRAKSDEIIEIGGWFEEL
ncbi:hypothetical protein K402DRAFT_420255 [Aulographum hederae CBS 113979]|uniref:RING-type domain-containing protein n=1 Tax=Aulographum hederae CBS 113979 TaxID=1176131 RepID=A0A6G1H305_9PEZI|nr:hypothetical protein K402DRAFT_420255 [Aulographum hederae CBS 113979]